MFVKVQFKDSKKFIKLQNGFTFTDLINEGKCPCSYFI